MSVLSFLEGHTQSRDAWLSQLGVAEHSFNQLCDESIFSKEERSHWRLRLVGLVIFRDRVLLARPKFDTTFRYDIATLLKLLTIYFGRSAGRKPLTQNEQHPEFYGPEVLRQFDTAVALRQWFADFGVYRREITAKSNAGRIDWTRTLAHKDPLISGEAVLYPSTVGLKKSSALNDVSDLQRVLTVNICRRYGLTVPSELSEEVSELAEIDLWSEPYRSYFLRRLISEQQRVYRSDTLRLFNLLKAALTEGQSNDGRPLIYGTTAFYALWEDACRTQLTSPVQTGEAALAHPTWFLPDGRQLVHEQIPDLIVEYLGTAVIIDAKYYYPFPSARPGAQDIAKQIVYEESLECEKKRSVFVLPVTDAPLPVYLGYATVEMERKTLPLVEAWGVDPYRMLATYPAYSPKYASNFFNRILDTPMVSKSVT